jgi:hypothetical protein
MLTRRPAITDPLTHRSALHHCDIRGCIGVGEYRYASTILDRPAVLVVCSLHRLGRWAFVEPTPTPTSETGRPGEHAAADSGPPTARPHATISRAEWLRLEIQAADQYVARHRDSDDPIERRQVHRREREADALRAQLDAEERDEH